MAKRGGYNMGMMPGNMNNLMNCLLYTSDAADE